MYIYIYNLLACSLEYSSLSTLAGLSYHICGKLEVAFKASPSSQPQHCTDEAQDVYLMLFRQVVWNVLNRCTISFADMAFGRSVVLHFPQEIQKNLGISEVAPQLLRALDAEMIDAVQFLKSGQVRVTWKTAEYRDDLLEGSTFLFGDVPIPVTAADQNIRFVFVRDLPFEVPDDDVKSVFERFGVVHSMSPCFFRDFPSVSNGTRRLVMSFREAIPSSVSVADFPVRVFHAGQPVICSVCHESGHLPRACPFSGLCLRCKQPGHVARNCTQAWGSSSSNVPVPASSSSTPVSMSVDPSVSSTASTSSTAPVSSVPSVTAPASVSPVTAVSTPIPSVLPVSTVSVPVSSALSTPVSSATLEDGEIAEGESGASSSLVSSPAAVQSTPVSVSSCCSTASGNEDVSMSPAGAPSSRPAASSRPPRTSSADYKRLIRLVVPKVKPGSDASAVKKQCIALVKSHKLNVSVEECSRIASSVCSGNAPRQMTDLFPVDFVMQVKTTLFTELNKVPAVQYLDVPVFTSKFMSCHAVPSRFRPFILEQAHAFVQSKK